MSHLSIERLAALADEQPTGVEHMHLESCAECAREVEAHRSLFAMAESERDAMGLPLTRWDSLAPKLRADGLIADPARGRPEDAALAPHRLLRVAAALLLVAGGAVLGRVSAGAGPMPGDAGRTASRFGADTLPTSFASVEEAQDLRNKYKIGYQRAVSFLAQQDSGRTAETPAVMRARLSALDRVSRITGEALKEAPYDPIINDFYLNSFGQREATLRELNTVLPQNVRLNSY
jgi:hypothetical protein